MSAQVPAPTSELPPFRAVAEVRVIMADTDAAGIVYHANYLRWFEVGRAELIRQVGLTYVEFSARGFALPVIEAHLRYRVASRYDDLLAVHARVSRLSRASVTFEYRLTRAGGNGTAPEVLICEGSTMHACTEPSGRPVRFPADAQASLERALQGR
jgi:acyl-CoA thioester hydrolase